MDDITSLSIKVDSTQVKQGATALNDLGKAGENAERGVKKVDSASGAMNRSLQTAKMAAIGVAAGITAISVALLTMSVKAIKDFAAYEKGLIGVQKTTDFTAKEMKKFQDSIQGISRTLPIATVELLAIAEAAGQLGVKGVDNVSKFTETMAKLQLATDVVGEEGAKQIARLLTITGEGVGVIGNFGAVLVALGNNAAASESEILALGSEIGQATSTFRLTANEVIGLAAGMKELGVRSELGGSVVARAMREIEGAIDSGGQSMKTLSLMTGIAGKDLKKTFQDDAVGVFQSWLKGMGGMINGGMTAVDVLDQFNLKGEEVLKVLPTMAMNYETVAKSMNLMSVEQKKGTALNIEAEKAAAGLDSQYGIFKNLVNEISISIGEDLAPMVKKIISDFKDWWKVNDIIVKQDLKTLFYGIGNAVKFMGEMMHGALKYYKAFSVNQIVQEINDLEVKFSVLQKGYFGKGGFGTGTQEEINAVEKKLTLLRKQLEFVTAAAKPLGEEYKELGDNYRQMGDQSVEATDKIVTGLFIETEATKKAAEEAKRSAEEYAAFYQSTLDRLLPLQKAQEDYNAALAVLNEMDPTRSSSDYITALSNLNNELAAITENYGREEERRIGKHLETQAELLYLAGQEYEATLKNIEANEHNTRLYNDEDAALVKVISSLNKKIAKQREEARITSEEANLRSLNLSNNSNQALLDNGPDSIAYIDARLREELDAIQTRKEAEQQAIQDKIDLILTAADVERSSIIETNRLRLDAEKATTQQELDTIEEKQKIRNKAEKDASRLVATSEALEKAASIASALAVQEAGRKKMDVYAMYASYAGQALFALSDMQDQSSKDGFESAKKYAAAATVVNTAAAVMSAMASPWPLSLINAGIAIATGITQLQNIESSSYEGGGTISGSVGKSSGSASPTATTGTVFGDSSASSESLKNATDLLSEFEEKQYTELRGIHREMVSLNSNITGLITGLIRSVGGEFEIGEIGSSPDPYSKISAIVIDPISATISKVVGSFIPLVGQLWDGLSKLFGGLLGGSTKTSITGSGIFVKPTTIADTMAGENADVGMYQDIKTTTKGALWGLGGSKTKRKTITKDADDEVVKLFTQVFKNMGATILDLSKGLGADLSVALSYAFEIPKLDLAGKTGSEITEAVTAALSTAFDNAADAILGNLVGKYQQVSEGMFETAVRVYSEQIIVLDALGKTGNATSGDILELTQSIVGLAGGGNEFMSMFENYIELFTTDNEKLSASLKFVKESFFELGLILPTTRKEFANLISSLDVTTESGRMAYVTLLSLADSTDQLYSAIEDVMESANDTLSKLGMSDAQKSLYDITKQYDEYIEILKASGAALSDIKKVEQARAGILKNAAGDLLANIEGQVINAESRRDAAQEKVNSLLEKSSVNLQSFSKSINSFLESLNLKTLGSSFENLKAQFMVTSSAAAAGDAEAMENLLSQANSVLSVAESNSASKLDYDRVVGMVRSQVEMVQGSIVVPENTGLTDLADAQSELALATKELGKSEKLYQEALLLTNNLTFEAADALSSLTSNVNTLRLTMIAYNEAFGYAKTGKSPSGSLPGFAEGTDYVPYDMTANIHEGERIVPAAYNRSDSTNTELLAEMTALRKEMNAVMYQVAKNTLKTADYAERSDGTVMRVTVVEETAEYQSEAQVVGNTITLDFATMQENGTVAVQEDGTMWIQEG